MTYTKSDAIKAVTISGNHLKLVGQYTEDVDVVVIAVTQNGYALKYAHSIFRESKRMVLSAIASNPHALKYASDTLRDDAELVEIAVRKEGRKLKYASARLRQNPQIVKIAISQDYYALKYAKKSLRSDKEIVMFAVKQCGLALKFARYEIRCDKEIVTLALLTYTCALKYVPDCELDDEVIEKVILRNSHAIKYTINPTETMILNAVSQNGMTLKYILPSYQTKQIVQIAVARNGKALKHVAQNFAFDKEIVAIAIKNAPCAFQYAHMSLWSDKELIDIISSRSGTEITLSARYESVKKEYDDVIQRLNKIAVVLWCHDRKLYERENDCQWTLRSAGERVDAYWSEMDEIEELRKEQSELEMKIKEKTSKLKMPTI